MVDGVRMLALALALTGAVVGSFLNVVIHRVPRHESVVRPASRCPACATPVAPRDNVPVLSWLALRGRCRACRAPVSARYPAVELLTAALFGLIGLVRGSEPDLLLSLPFAAVLVAVAGIDLEHRIVPNRILAPAAGWAVAAAALVHPDRLPELLGAGALAFALLLMAALARPAGMGMGDVKLAGVIGLYLGASAAPALLAAFFAGSVVALGVLARRGAAARSLGLPFAPFLALGGVLGIVAGPELVDLYTSRFLA